MKFHESITLPLSPTDAARMYADPRYASVRAEVLGADSASSRTTGSPDGEMTVVTELKMPTDRVPDIARKFVGERISVEETQSWQAPEETGERSGTMRFTVAGLPVCVEGESRLLQEGDQSRLDVSGDLSAKIPLVGGKLEKAAVPYIGRVLQAEARAAQRYIQGS